MGLCPIGLSVLMSLCHYGKHFSKIKVVITQCLKNSFSKSENREFACWKWCLRATLWFATETLVVESFRKLKLFYGEFVNGCAWSSFAMNAISRSSQHMSPPDFSGLTVCSNVTPPLTGQNGSSSPLRSWARRRKAGVWRRKTFRATATWTNENWEFVFAPYSPLQKIQAMLHSFTL